MCGFVGIMALTGNVSEQFGDADRILRALHHRGPDGQGHHQASWISLFHARLSVIDTTDAASQPMIDHTGRYVIVFNGTIYNYRQLFRDHCPQDGTVNGNSDTAVLLYLFAKYEKACLDLLDGMFAFAVADLNRQTVFLARDRFGEKPLYWVRERGHFAFGSELRALKAALPERNWDIDAHSQALYHTLGNVPAPRTIFKGVNALLPGEWLETDSTARVRTGTYWTLGAAVSGRSSGYSETGAAAEKTRELLLAAVQSRTVSDVPIGLFLSGGFDSGSIMGLLEATGTPMHNALTLDFEEPQFSEFAVAKHTAKHYGGTVRRHSITASDFISGLPGFFKAMDQPTADGYNTYFVCQAAKTLGIKVWLSGMGGDELFEGYPFVRRIAWLKRLSQILQTVLPESVINHGTRIAGTHFKVSRLLQLGDTGLPVKRAYQTARNVIPWRSARMVLARQAWSPEWRFSQMLDAVYPECLPYFDNCQQAILMESSVYMRSQLLPDMDNFSMAHSIELRAPFLQHRLFETVFALPESAKQTRGKPKLLLAAALPKPLPEAVLRQPKMGFTFPVEIWLKKHLQQSFAEVALDRANQDYWNLDIAARLWQAYRNGQAHWSIIWQLYAFARWRDAQRARG
jgi:asparagine synthase (glutamine-hydrolysing)